MISLLKIIKYGHPLLREKALELKGIGSRERDLIASMATTMYAARGIGLAATQVGVLERLFIVDVDQDRDEDDEVQFRRLQVFINPEIIAESEEDSPFTEGCLSIPGLDGEIHRPMHITVTARDENFQPFTVEATELLARVIQHEQDHLNGILFVDHLPLLKRPFVAGHLHKLKKNTQEELPGLSGQYPVYL